MNLLTAIHLFHMLVVAPILLIIGYRVLTGTKMTMLEGYLLVVMAVIAFGRHLQLIMAGR